LLDIVDLRYPTHHPFTPEFPECLKVKMPEPLVPAPGLIVPMSCEAEGSDHFHVKHVQPVAPVVDLGEEMVTTVLDPEHPRVNLHPRATLIELDETGDGVPEGQNVVHPMEQLEIAGLNHKHDRPDTADLHDRLVAKLDEASNVAVQVNEMPNASDHVVHGTAVEVPSLKLVVIRVVTEEDLCVQFIDVEQGRRGERRCGVSVRGS
jgi:hypothetical protein